MEWNNDWRDELKYTDYGCYERLCECKNRVADVKRIAVLMYKYNQDKSPMDCLDRTIEWLVGLNNQIELMDMLYDNNERKYNQYLAHLQKGM